jgi:hypothetical protein
VPNIYSDKTLLSRIWTIRTDGRIDLTVDARYGPGEGTVLQELEALQRLGLVVRDDSRSGVGGRWKVTAAARPYIQ